MSDTVSAVSHQHDRSLLDAFFLPDLCNTRAILFLLAVSEGLVAILTLMESSLAAFSWERFGLVSLFVQWVALLSVAVLCQLRFVLVQVNVMLVSVLALLLVQLVTLGVGLMADWLWPTSVRSIDWLWLARNALVSALVTALALRYFYVQSQWRIQAQAELKARLSALQANIRPHFFFNTLNTVAALIVIDPEKAENMLLDLAQLFRVVLKADDTPSTLEQEIEFGQRYLDIEHTRLGTRLTIEWQLPDPLPEIIMPTLILQPLLENAVYHGIQPLVGGGWIRISLTPVTGGWELMVANARVPGSSKPGNGIAQRNIRARLDTLFGDSARLQTLELADEYQARIMIPLYSGERTHELSPGAG
ncbi:MULTISPECIES: sensor histidine kinase [unclassified Oceanobacter]|uniref:sensor histidine kinase n=1 Tax=unclassified Oceanobacter TaxID=2620260 RepID=UPI0027334A30|nr:MULTISPECIES: histidine kinase [unclassified Oceanobacter]MDP2607781.1 histidine kinase [Oceanobacter sp. 1_MG-2023]MDP2611035.1 histidine kinase [Oceanobacter sp. 2_MG-2023]